MITCPCGKEFEAARRTAKFCSSGCRVRAHRAPAGSAPAAPTAAVVVASSEREPAAPLPSEAGGLHAATMRELQAVGRTNTAGGQAALVLAQMLDNRSPLDGGSAIAALVREHRNTLAAAVAGAQKEADPVDELTAKRNQRRTGTAAAL